MRSKDFPQLCRVCKCERYSHSHTHSYAHREYWPLSIDYIGPGCSIGAKEQLILLSLSQQLHSVQILNSVWDCNIDNLSLNAHYNSLPQTHDRAISAQTCSALRTHIYVQCAWKAFIQRSWSRVCTTNTLDRFLVSHCLISATITTHQTHHCLSSITKYTVHPIPHLYHEWRYASHLKSLVC